MRRDVFSLSGPAAFVALPRSSTAFMKPLNLFWMFRYWLGSFGMTTLLADDDVMSKINHRAHREIPQSQLWLRLFTGLPLCDLCGKIFIIFFYRTFDRTAISHWYISVSKILQIVKKTILFCLTA